MRQTKAKPVGRGAALNVSKDTMERYGNSMGDTVPKEDWRLYKHV